MVRRISTKGIANTLNIIKMGVDDLSNYFNENKGKSILYDINKTISNILIITAYNKLIVFINTKIAGVFHEINRLNVIFVKKFDIYIETEMFEYNEYYSYFLLVKYHRLLINSYYENHDRGPPNQNCN